MTDRTHLPTTDAAAEDRRSDITSNRDQTETALERRSYMQLLATLGVATPLLGAASETATAQAASDDWESAADERIETHRTGDLEVVVEDDSGERVADADVAVEMDEHAFGFGVAIDAPTLLEADETDPYREHTRELFNTVVLGDHHKWRFFDDNPQPANDATAWALEHDLDVRGHTCLWGNVNAWSIPPDVVEAMGVDWPEGGADDPDYDPEYVRERTLDHIEDLIEHYGDDIMEWEIVNEVLHETALIAAVEEGPDEELEPTAAATAPILAEWYDHAQTIADREGVGIAVNDYNTLEGDYADTQAAYHDQIQFLLEEGIDLDGIGFQCHFDAAETLEPEAVYSILDEFVEYDVGLRITEFDTFQELQGVEWESDEAKGEFLSQFLTTVYSHPAVEQFVLWGLWDGDHWGENFDGHEADAPLFYEDWEPKPGYDAYTDLVFEQWWTDESGATDSSGRYETQAFLGTHEVTVTVDETTVTETVSVTESDGTTEVVVTVSDDSEEISVGGYEPQDTTGDGLANDITGDGQSTHDDVAVFFEHIDGDTIQENPQLFDFAETGDVGFRDALALLRTI
ncbi:endo-1,4-beta-xylanase [Natronolimnobius baerhuensis]|uniref:endo-1,4-beta-xylanase n=1 Tax=Natronolimnobius baerhuensis TaxID=253108 RepID=A0A202EDM1_9EURY|nr:endo-1,4-beta-xylanase [Natronolimnobius baerhuensis]OVE86288.1 hypothetical protein B2G88_05775 [Natronolimnobius baerhuensis]